MKRLLVFLLCASAVFLSCKDNQVGSALNSAEISMNDNPESSLEVLESIDKDLLSTRKQKAKYALLYSMALDKNYIDIKADSIIAPAVKYYECHGSKEDRFLCNYYRARIYENAGDNENALLYAAKAESLDTSRVSAESKCLLYAMKGRVYYDARKLINAIEAYELACKYSLRAGKYCHYANYCLRLADVYIYNHDNANLNKYIKLAEQFHSYFGTFEIHNYSRLIILSMLWNGIATKDYLDYIDNYIKEHPQYDMIQWHIIAKAYLSAGCTEEALTMLDNYAKYYDVSLNISYYGILSDVLEELGDYERALNAQKIFAELVKEEDVKRHRSDIEVVEDSYRSELIQTRQRHYTSYAISISILLLTLLLYMNIKWKVQRQHNKKDLEELQQEYAALVSLKERMDGTYQYLSGQISKQSHTDQELMKVLGQRIKSLAAFRDTCKLPWHNVT
ncbi:MAG: hypothetical protein E7114_05755 [Bacteroidales bacterium]|nr:hypothetical protein [Bacteroidales bacterium]